jgi:hypothetical protein
MKTPHRALRRSCAALAAVATVATAACTVLPDEPPGPPAKQTLYVVNDANRLIALNAGRPHVPLRDRALAGLQPGERLVGIDFRVAKGVLYALSQAGRLYTLDIPSGALRPVGFRARCAGAAGHGVRL